MYTCMSVCAPCLFSLISLHSHWLIQQVVLNSYWHLVVWMQH